jgi:hypothetical protein
MNYEKGLKILEILIQSEDTETCNDFDLYKARLCHYLSEKKQYGSNLEAEIFQVIEQLNSIARRLIGASFNDLCIDNPITWQQLAEIKNLLDHGSHLASNEELRLICRNCIPDNLPLPVNYNKNNILVDILGWLVKLGRSSSEHIPLLEFIKQLMPFIHDATVTDKLQLWIENVSQQLQLEQNQDSIAQFSSSQTYLLIKIERKNKTLNTYIVQAWLSKGQNTIYVYPNLPKSEERKLTLTEMPKLVDEIIEDIYQKFGFSKQQLTIEFFLPKHLLSHHVDHWTTETEFDEPIGCRFPVVVRSKERFEQSRLLHRLRDYWDNKALHDTPKASLIWLETPDLKGMRKKLEKGMIFFVLKFVPDERFLSQLIALGVPLIFWSRKIENDNEVNELNTLLSCEICQKLGQLPEIVRQERLRIVDDEIDKQYITYHLSLLWDDYDRQLPKSAFGQNYSDLEGH